MMTEIERHYYRMRSNYYYLATYRHDSEEKSVDIDVRAGDADRDRTINILREAFALGFLKEEEWAERFQAASTSYTAADLSRLVADLPSEVRSPCPPKLPVKAAAPRRTSWWPVLLLVAPTVCLYVLLFAGSWAETAALMGAQLSAIVASYRILWLERRR